MKQTISKCITKMLSCVAVVSVVVGMVMFTGCKSNSSADLVFYGTKNMLQSSLVSNWLSHR